jgi:hypothetical protein
MRKPANRGKKFPTKTDLQRNALTLIAKALKSGKPFVITDLLLKAGYAEASALQFTNVMESLKPHLDPIVARLEAHRDKILEKMEVTLDGGRVTYGELTRALDVTTRSARLLGGKSTSNLAVLHGDRRRELDALIDDNETDEGED